MSSGISGISGTIQDIVDISNVAVYSKTAQFAGKHFIFDPKGDHEEVEPAYEDTRPRLPCVQVLDVESILCWAGLVSKSDPEKPGVVQLGRAGTTIGFWPATDDPRAGARDRCTKDFYGDFLPSERWLPVDDFMLWVDKIRPGMGEDAGDLLDAALKGITGSKSEVVEVEIDGATINAKVQSGTRVEGKAQLPKRIKSKVPFGDPAFTTECSFVLGVRIGAGKGLEFRAVHDTNDGSFERWIGWAKAHLASLPDGWTVLVTA